MTEMLLDGRPCSTPRHRRRRSQRSTCVWLVLWGFYAGFFWVPPPVGPCHGSLDLKRANLAGVQHWAFDPASCPEGGDGTSDRANATAPQQWAFKWCMKPKILQSLRSLTAHPSKTIVRSKKESWTIQCTPDKGLLVLIWWYSGSS